MIQAAEAKKLSRSRILVSGINGLGAEIVKNLILSGVRRVTLHDTKLTSAADLGSHFFLSEEDIGKNRASASAANFSGLNRHCLVEVVEEELSSEIIALHNVVVLVETSTKKAIEINEFCRNFKPEPIAFIRTDALGLFGSVFTDFGPSFLVLDTDGEPASSNHILAFKDDGEVKLYDDDDVPSFYQDSFVTFSEVEGDVELNGKEFQVGLSRGRSFYIKDAPENLSKASQGIVHHVKKPKTLNFLSLADSLNDPRFVDDTDFAKFGRAPLLHVIHQALFTFQEETGRFPGVSEEDTVRVTALTVEINDKSQNPTEINEIVIRQMTQGCAAVISPMASVLGGIVAQEVLKAAYRVHHPIFQFLYFDALECLPLSEPSPDQRAAQNSRYDHLALLFGKEFLITASEKKIFLAGAGSIGCELLKNFALSGLGTGSGFVAVTDHKKVLDRDLSTHFLLREQHLEQFKSESVVEELKRINRSINIRPYQEPINEKSDKVFDDRFWAEVDFAVSNLGTYQETSHLDSLCIFHEKPLFFGGSLGPKCNTGVILPRQTAHYGSQPNDPEKSIPTSTVNSFPYKIEHCMEWAERQSRQLFEANPHEINNFLTDTAYFEHIKNVGVYERIRIAQSIISGISHIPKSFDDCVQWARLKFEEFFTKNVESLLAHFPRDYKRHDGTPFWNNRVRLPTVARFDLNDATHLDFVLNGANVLANVFGVNVPLAVRTDANVICSVLERLEAPVFEPISFPEDDDKEAELNKLLERIPRSIPVAVKNGKYLEPQVIGEEEHTEFLVKFITAAINLRARTFRIEEIDFESAKNKIEKIKPSLITTACFTSGLLVLEIFKLLNHRRSFVDMDDHGDFRNTCNNLAIPMIMFYEPEVPVVQKSGPKDDLGFTVWDKIHIYVSKSSTLAEMFALIKREHNLDVEMFAVASTLIYANFMKKSHDRLALPILQLLSDRKIDLGTKHYFVSTFTFTKDDEEVETPAFVIHFTDL